MKSALQRTQTTPSKKTHRTGLRTALFTLVAAGLIAPAAAHAKTVADPSVPAVTKGKVQIVFALDTTGSMGGLIEGAKRKIWYVANEVLKSERQPQLEVGLVAYRDKGDAYVTQVVPLTSDLDAVYEKLRGLSANGGGDGPEHVNAALHDAVHKMQWSDGKDVLKLIFLVGDAPPHMDYKDDVKHTVTSRVAIRRNIYINTLQCGTDRNATAAWKTIALNSEGRYAAVPQDGGVVAMVTPFDDELGRLATDLDGTELSWGKRDKKSARKAKRARASGYAAAAPTSTRAERALVKNKIAVSADDDFVNMYADKGAAALGSVAAEELPDELIGKDRPEQERIVKQKQQKRRALNKKIADIEKKRAAWIAKERKNAPASADAFDAEVVEAIEAQAAEIGMDL